MSWSTLILLAVLFASVIGAGFEWQKAIEFSDFPPVYFNGNEWVDSDVGIDPNVLVEGARSTPYVTMAEGLVLVAAICLVILILKCVRFIYLYILGTRDEHKRHGFDVIQRPPCNGSS